MDDDFLSMEDVGLPTSVTPAPPRETLSSNVYHNNRGSNMLSASGPPPLANNSANAPPPLTPSRPFPPTAIPQQHVVWQLPDQDKPIRQLMITKIHTLLKSRKPDAEPDWLQKLPGMAKKLEDKLYRHAKSMDEYNEEPTLKHRLQQIAIEMRTDQQHFQPPASSQQQPPLQHSQQHPLQRAQSAAAVAAIGTVQQSNIRRQPASEFVQGSVTVPPPSSVGPVVHQQLSPVSPSPSVSMSGRGGGDVGSKGLSGSGVNGNGTNGVNGGKGPSGTSSTAAAAYEAESVKQQQQQRPLAQATQGEVLRQQQHRLLLLRHASKCQALVGECKATPHCSQMKELWRHIGTCKDQNCKVAHCVSSRFVLAHYHKCKEANCQVCEPVRAAIQRPDTASSSAAPPSNPPNAPQPLMQSPASSLAPASQTVSSQYPLAQPQKHVAVPASPDSKASAWSAAVPAQRQLLQELMHAYTNHLKAYFATSHNIKAEQAKYNVAKEVEKKKGEETKQAKEEYMQLCKRLGDGNETNDVKASKLQWESAKLKEKSSITQCKILEINVKAMKVELDKFMLADKDFVSKILVAYNGDNQQAAKFVQGAKHHVSNVMRNVTGPRPQQQGASAGGEAAAAANLQPRMQPPQQPPAQLQQHPQSQQQPQGVKSHAAGNGQKHNAVAVPDPYRRFPPEADSNSIIPSPTPSKVVALATAIVAPTSVKVGSGPTGVRKNKRIPVVAEVVTMAPPQPAAVPVQPDHGHKKASKRLGHPAVAAAVAAAAAAAAAAVAVNKPVMLREALGPKPGPPPPPPAHSGTAQHQQRPPTSAVVHHAPLPLKPHGIFREVAVASIIILETSLINTFPRADIEAHIRSLHLGTLKNWRDFAIPTLKQLQQMDENRFFDHPVDPIRDQAPDYNLIVRHPMDLGTIRYHLESNAGWHSSLDDFVKDVRRTFSNCLLYNSLGSPVAATGLRLGQYFERTYSSYREREEALCHDEHFNKDQCRLCAPHPLNLTFEQVALYCANPRCKTPRIKKGQLMYASSDNRNWCSPCFKELGEIVVLNDGTQIHKHDLKKTKPPEPTEEGWVNCYSCKRWYHQVCAMLNTKRGQDTKKDDFLCPICVLYVLESNKMNAFTPRQGSESKHTASALPVTKLSEYLERAVNSRVARARAERSKQSRENLQDVEFPGQLCVRVVMSKEAEVVTRVGMLKVYENFPKVFNSKQKCVLVFEKLDGVDVLIFVMFMQYYGSDCPLPNQRCLYIAYLDSVYYFRPAFLRTAVYHELITAAFEYEKSNGFTRCFIWACPPQGGDDYIFHVHPKTQKTPKPDRLRLWYLTLLEDARLRGIVVSISNLFDEYLSRVPELSQIPYFEGDWFPSYGESYLEEIERDHLDPNARQSKADAVRLGSDRRAKALKEANDSIRAQAASFGGNGGGVNTPVPSRETPEAAAARKKQKRARVSLSGPSSSKGRGMSLDLSFVALEDESSSQAMMEVEGCDGPQATAVVPGMPPALICPPPRPLDQVPLQSYFTARVAAENYAMKDDFIVVKMFYDCVECSTSMDYPGALYWISNQYDPKLDPHDYKKHRYAPPYCLCHDCYRVMYEAEYKCELVFVEPVFPPPSWAEEDATNKSVEAAAVTASAAAAASATSTIITEKASTEKLSPTTKRGQSRSFSVNSPLVVSPLPVPPPPPSTILKPELPASLPKIAGSNGNRRKRKGYSSDFVDLESIESSDIEILENGKTARIPNPYPKTPIPCSLKNMHIQVAMIRYKTRDSDPLMECAIFDRREDFLSLCQGNRYQFDELRRAKHSSMMVLYHLHNPDSDAFVHTCNGCKMDIVGTRYTCHSCTDFDLCDSCHADGKIKHGHKLDLVQSTSSGNTSVTGENRTDARQDSTQTQLRILEHTVACSISDCKVTNCVRMRDLLRHVTSCPIPECVTCKRFNNFLAVHAKQCRMPLGKCKVLNCDRFKALFRAQSQQIADRRAAMASIRPHTAVDGAESAAALTAPSAMMAPVSMAGRQVSNGSPRGVGKGKGKQSHA